MVKRADGRFQKNIQIGIDPATGKRKFKTIYARTKIELRDKEIEIRNALNTGTYADDKGLTVGEWALKWLELEKASVSPPTRANYKLAIDKHIVPNIGDIALRNLTRSDIQLIVNNNIDKPHACKHIRLTIKQILNAAVEENLIYKNVASKLSLPKIPKPNKRQLTDIEREALKKADFNEIENLFINILLYTGARRGEILALATNNVDLKNRIIRIRETLVLNSSKPYIKSTPKTDAGNRDIPIPDALYVILKTYLKQNKDFYLFLHNGKLFTQGSYGWFFSGIIKKMNYAAGGTEDLKVIHGLTAHIFRHNYATNLYYAGIDLKQAQYLLGHSNIKITLEIYTHLEEDKIPTLDKLNSIAF